jgi:glycosyltransferase involved in cell wall biosynthesis
VISTSYHPADRRETWFTRQILRLDDVAFGMTAYRVARAIVVQSELEARLLKEFAPADRVRIVPPGVDLQEWRDPARDRTEGLGLPADYFLFVGRIASNKGLPNLVDALAGLAPADRLPLVLMGADWGERATLEARARRLGIADSLVWLGHVPDRAGYRGVIRRARALVLPSEWEAYGFVLLEAMAARTPVVATAVGAVPEVLQLGALGRLVPYGDARAMQDALRSIRADPEGTARRVERGWAHVQTLDWAASAERFRTLYRDVARC